MGRMVPVGRLGIRGASARVAGPGRRGRTLTAAGLVAVLTIGTLAVVERHAAPAWAAPAPGPTASIYERGAAAATLAAQGAAAGRAGSQGAVILDFGRPAYRAGTYGTMTYGGTFVPLTAVAASVEGYIGAYFLRAPRHAALEVVVGTNNSCGTGQPCGSVPACGCRYEPPSYRAWGARFAAAVEQVSAWTAQTRQRHGYTDAVRVAAGDDAEPGFDPGYWNTYYLLDGYARAVGGATPAMVDFGDAAPVPWTAEQLYQVAYGLRPDVPFPEIYYLGQPAQWAALAAYASRAHGVTMRMFGVLTQDPAGYTSDAAYHRFLAALGPVTGQTSIGWRSEIGPEPGHGRAP